MNRVIMERILNRPLELKEQVDHIDNDSLNNRRENLRLATASQNQWNSKRPVNNTSGYKGVQWDKRLRKWYAKCQKEHRQYCAGWFTTREEAYAAYCKLALELHGEFANFGETP